MADVRAIYAVGNALVTSLTRAFQRAAWPGEPTETKPGCTFQLVGGKALTGTPTLSQGVLLFLYRVAWNEHMRHLARQGAASSPKAVLGLDLHYLLIPWADEVQNEHSLLAWTMRELEQRPVLGPGDLTGGGFSEGESIQIVPGELSHEDLMRIWDAIDPPFRVSLPYVARVVRVDLDLAPEARPVVVRKLVFEQMGSAEREEP